MSGKFACLSLALLPFFALADYVGPTFEVKAWRGETLYADIPDWATGECGFRKAAKDGVECEVFSLGPVMGAVKPMDPRRMVRMDTVEQYQSFGASSMSVCKISVAPTAASGSVEFGPLKVTVIDRVLPPPAEWKYHLDLWQHPWAVARYHRVKPFSKEHYAHLRPVYATLASAGQKVLTTTLVELPWNHQCFDAYHSMIGRVRHADGSWTFDYSVFDEYVAFGRSCGIGPDIACYTMCPWEYVVRWQDDEGKTHQVAAKPGTPEFADFWGDFLVDFAAHLRAKGWLKDAYVAMDERSPEDVKAIIDLVRAKAPGLKVSMAGNRNPADFKGLTIDCYSQLLSELDEPFLAEVKRRRAAGLKTTLYVCCVPERPNTVWTSEREEAFWLGAYPEIAGFDGFLRWAANSWPVDPGNDATFGTWPAGDTFLVYPHGVPSLRFLELRAGIVAAEKLRILRAQGEVAELPAELAALYDFRKAGRGEIDYRAAKEGLSALVNR